MEVKMVRISQMRQKEVINISDGKRLGFICDVEFDLENGQIKTLIVPAAGRMMGLFSKDNDICIPWDSIVRIGDDIVLVEYVEQYSKRR